MIRITYTHDGERRTEWFTDVYKAQARVIELQKLGIKFEVKRT